METVIAMIPGNAFNAVLHGQPRRWTRRAAGLALATLLAAVAACTGARRADVTGTSVQAPLAAAPILAMTFNIRYGTARDGDHAWPLRRHVAFQAIRDFAPTVLGVQEALRFQLDEIAHELEHYGELGVGRDDGIERGEYSAILYDRRRLEPLDHGTFWLSDTPAVPGSMTWGNRITRIATWARLLDRAGGNSFYVFNTHWDHESQPSRERSAALILDRIRARAVPADPVLLMGDFNAGEDNAAFQALLAAGAVNLFDTFRAVHPDARETGTFHAFRGDRTGDRIDAILASPHWQPVAAEIVHLQQSGLYPSDHFPVTAIVVLRARAPPRAPEKLPR
ncbi:MAG TPA: endonuclease/exonuclease/phosphatase family protein [Longimicrobiales bacterium]|nr:endonuclease/exonuclease/phosphatase family protein [Longimicrobiales bacterium]